MSDENILSFPLPPAKPDMVPQAAVREVEAACFAAAGNPGAFGYSCGAMARVVASYRLAMDELQRLDPGNPLLAAAGWE